MKNVALALMAYEHAWKICGLPSPIFDFAGVRVNVIYGLVVGILSLYLAQGFHLTRDREDYFNRLFFFAVISQFPFSMISDRLNVLFTYLLAFMAIYAYQKNEYFFCYLTLLMSVLYNSCFDWGYIAVFSIFAFFVILSYFPNKKITYDLFRLPKFFYYAFYPVHFFILIGINFVT